jgi:hypothetical protein
MRPLNLIEKLILHAAYGETNDMRVGSVVLLNVDWVLASELSWAGIDKGVFRFPLGQLRVTYTETTVLLQVMRSWEGQSLTVQSASGWRLTMSCTSWTLSMYKTSSLFSPAYSDPR